MRRRPLWYYSIERATHKTFFKLFWWSITSYSTRAMKIIVAGAVKHYNMSSVLHGALIYRWRTSDHVWKTRISEPNLLYVLKYVGSLRDLHIVYGSGLQLKFIKRFLRNHAAISIVGKIRHKKNKLLSGRGNCKSHRCFIAFPQLK